MRWSVAFAMGLVAWGAYSLSRTRSASLRLPMPPNSTGNGRAAPPSEPSTASQERGAPGVDDARALESPRLIHVSWSVQVPQETPPGDFIYICGNHPALGYWNPMGVALHPVGNGLYRGDLRMPVGTTFEYKFTRGTWRSVEVSRNGADRPNRILDRRDSGTIESDVEAWADML